MPQSPPPGTFRIDDDQLLRVGGHVGWFSTEMGLYTYCGERTLVPRKLLSAGPSDLAQHDPLRKVDPRRFPRIAAAAALCPLVVVPDGTASPHALFVRWEATTDSGLVSDAATGRKFEDSLDRYLLTPMAAGEVRALVAALQKPADGDDAREWSEFLEKAAGVLQQGQDDEEVRGELATVLGTSIDRIIRAVSGGGADEDAVELAMELAWQVNSDDRAALKEWEERLDARLRDADAIDEAERLLAQLKSEEPVVETPWGPAHRFVRPKVVCLGGTVLPEEAVRYFPDADSLPAGTGGEG